MVRRPGLRKRPFLLHPDPDAPFPPAELALREPDGLLAVGGDLTPARLRAAYRGGIFPWPVEDTPLLWWSPDPRMVFRTDAVHLSTRFRRDLRRSTWTVTADTAFGQVMDACAHTPRLGEDGTWITPEMRAAYVELHRLGNAHSVEVWDAGTLVGAVYGVSLGRMFFGESMVSPASGGSKVALAALAHRLHAWGYPLIDAQVATPHLESLGATSWPRAEFLPVVQALADADEPAVSWTDRFGTLAASELA